MHVPFVDLKAQYQGLRPEILSAVETVLDSMQLFLGPQTRALEEEFGRYCGVDQAVAVSNGTDALFLALKAAGIGPGDEVITVSHTFFATVEAIALTGARPVLVDVEPDTLTMDVARAEEKVTPRTRAILPVHLYGRLANMEAVVTLAQRHNLTVIEDAAQAHGAEREGRRAGSFGDIGCFSFYFSKNLGAYGEAGMCVTSNPDLARSLRRLRDHGSDVRYHHDTLAGNYRMDEIQAAILRVKLPHLDKWNAARRDRANLYTGYLADGPVEVPGRVNDLSHVFHLYVVRSGSRDRLRAELEAAGIQTGIHYPIPVHLQPASAAYGYQPGDLPVTESAASEILSLPMYPELSDEQIGYIAEAVNASASPV